MLGAMILQRQISSPAGVTFLLMTFQRYFPSSGNKKDARWLSSAWARPYWTGFTPNHSQRYEPKIRFSVKIKNTHIKIQEQTHLGATRI